ncbi:hypothetical protein FC89_GL000038 [Liquorilactobacillus ghanensis DSM 18630]|uniref:Nucleic acid-binding protein n=1 Tax=Liquorilactobacillus ghanensis DSM 18630 TaxID=1423750 RepID=A0A0R1VP43_9LACO|nr:YceD family protein [Liquorilactobacillus ghanensis]KRM07600.1 hypothetical protein FC89_GL000038 [Liquorilactobacillus ghanensis DSM 18630]
MIKWTLDELRRNCTEPLALNETVDISSLIKSKNENVISVSPAKVNGFFSLDQLGLLGTFKIKIKLVLPSTRSLQPVNTELSFTVSEYYVDHQTDNLAEFGKNDVVIFLADGLLDLSEVVCENVLARLPLKVLTPEEAAGKTELPKGNDWQVVEEGSSANAKVQVDPRLAKLKDFFKD